MYKSSFILFSLLTCFYSCNDSIDSKEELLTWMADVDNGYVKKNRANGFLLSMKYLPTEYLAINEMNKDGNSSKLYNEYLKEFENSKTFILTIVHEDKTIDASTYKVSNLSEYSKRITDLSFNIKDIVYLKTNTGKKISPVLTTMENEYELGNKKTFYLVFSDEGKIMASEKIDIILEDTFLDTGLSHFVFDTNKLNSLPNLKFVNQ